MVTPLEIAKHCRVGEFWKDCVKDKVMRIIFATTVTRYSRKCENVILAVEKGEFPNVRGHKIID